METQPKIGLLALQGAFFRHGEILKSMGLDPVEVRLPEDLENCDGLIIPGGESTTILKLIHQWELLEPLRTFAKDKPIFGTCAGIILMAREVNDANLTPPLSLLDISVERNAYGRQLSSFSADLDLSFQENGIPFHSVFIRAPRIRNVGVHTQVLAAHEGEPVLVQQGFHMAACFHPELTQDTRVHEYFVSLVRENTSVPAQAQGVS